MDHIAMEPAGHASGALSHPFHLPPGSVLSGYVPNSKSAMELVSGFSMASNTVLLVTWALARWYRPSIARGDALIAMWFGLCGCIHLSFELYAVFNSSDLATRTDFLGQLLKEYALADSRYLTHDPSLLCSEMLAAFVMGPASLAAAWLVIADHPMRHVVQLVLSAAHLYSTVLYYGVIAFQELVNGVVYRRPERVYFWGYYVFSNSFWVVVPAILIMQSARVVSDTFARAKASSAARKAQ